MQRDILGFLLGIIGTIIFLFGGIATIRPTPFIVLVILLAAIGVGFAINMVVQQFFATQDKIKDASEKVRREQARNDFSNIGQVSGISAEDFRRVITDTRNKLDTLRDMSAGLFDYDQGQKILALTVTGNRIIDEVLRDPKDFTLARTWFNIHVDQVIGIVDQYEKLPSVTSTMKTEFDSTLDKLVINFNNLLDHMKDNDLTSLKVDMAVLNDQLKVENR